MQDQVSDEGLQAVGIDGRDGASGESDAQGAEQADPHGGHSVVYDEGVRRAVAGSG